MIAFLLMMQAAATALPPSDWAALPPLRLAAAPDYSGVMTRFVRDEVAAGRCAVAPAGGKAVVRLDLAVLVANGSNQLLRVVPRAINCPTVEQFAAGVVEKAARGNIVGPPPAGDAWFRTTITLSWDQ